MLFKAFIIKNINNNKNKISNIPAAHLPISGKNNRKLCVKTAVKPNTNDWDADFLTNSSSFSIIRKRIPVKYIPTYDIAALYLLLKICYSFIINSTGQWSLPYISSCMIESLTLFIIRFDTIK